MMIELIARLVEASRRAALWLVLGALVMSVAGGYYAATHLSIDTDTNHLLSPDLPWRQRETAMERAFPQNVDLLAIVVDAATPDQAEDASAALAKALSARPELFRTVRRPDGGAFFLREGMLFAARDEVQSFADELIAAQPLIGTLAADPSLRGIFDALDLTAQGVAHGDTKLAALDRPYGAVAEATQSALAGKPHPLSWQLLFTGKPASPRELRRFVLAQPVLDYSALEPGGRASAAVRSIARELGLTPDQGVRVRLTGPVALSDEEFGSVVQGAGFSTTLSLVLVCLWLYLALRHLRIILAILATLVVGLVATGAFAAAAVGALNMISIAFAVLFIGLSVDFSIQFSVRYRDERYRAGEPSAALRRAATGVGAPLAVAAATTAVGFLSFTPTDYTGVSELGLIAGVSMVIALILNLMLLPALLTVLRPQAERAPVGFAWAAGIDALILRRRRTVGLVALVLAVASLAMLPRLQFDFDPLDLKDPHSESVSTLFDLMADPMTTPYTMDVLEPSPSAAAALAARLEKLPEVAQAVNALSYVPEDQEAKLAIIADAAMLLGPTLSPPQTAPPPDDAAILEAIRKCAADIAGIAAAEGPARRLATALDQVLTQGAPALPALRRSLAAGLENRLKEMRLALDAKPVALDDLPADLKRAWIAADGRARIEVFPKGDARNREVLRRFVAAVRSVAPDAGGTPISIQESGDTVVHAFSVAGIAALVAITLLLTIVLRRLRDVALVLAPLLLAALFTGATMVLAGMPLNYANIITLPLLLGIGVAFDIYFVMNWRAGMTSPLASSTARAVLFSALTTGTAFGSLALSNHPGTSEMGKLLTMALGYVLACTFLVLPALLGPARPPAASEP